MLLKTGQKIAYPKEIDEIIMLFDEKTLELVLSNLVHNAIKYSPENATIKITVTQQNKNLVISVIDHGIGISSKEQVYVFDRYFRAENALLIQGTGIGLNICQQHLENLGATIHFISTENSGSTFTVNIPQ
jgi:signal transduction histidine kinase